MLASNLNRLFLHMKKYHFEFPIRFFLSYQVNIRSNYCNPQIIYVANSFFFSCCKPSTCMSQSPGGSYTCRALFIVLTFFFCFSSAFFTRISRYCHLTEKIFFTLPSLQNIRNTFGKFFLLPVICFSAMLRVVKMDQGATDICRW